MLTSVLVIDNLGQDCPVAWLLSSRENATVLTAFLKALKNTVEDAGLAYPQPRTFMSDCNSESSFNARQHSAELDVH